MKRKHFQKITNTYSKDDWPSTNRYLLVKLKTEQLLYEMLLKITTISNNYDIIWGKVILDTGIKKCSCRVYKMQYENTIIFWWMDDIVLCSIAWPSIKQIKEKQEFCMNW